MLTSAEGPTASRMTDVTPSEGKQLTSETASTISPMTSPFPPDTPTEVETSIPRHSTGPSADTDKAQSQEEASSNPSSDSTEVPTPLLSKRSTVESTALTSTLASTSSSLFAALSPTESSELASTEMKPASLFSTVSRSAEGTPTAHQTPFPTEKTVATSSGAETSSSAFTPSQRMEEIPTEETSSHPASTAESTRSATSTGLEASPIIQTVRTTTKTPASPTTTAMSSAKMAPLLSTTSLATEVTSAKKVPSPVPERTKGISFEGTTISLRTVTSPAARTTVSSATVEILVAGSLLPLFPTQATTASSEATFSPISTTVPPPSTENESNTTKKTTGRISTSSAATTSVMSTTVPPSIRKLNPVPSQRQQDQYQNLQKPQHL
nr:cell wall protein RBR3-like [Zootoca vivipara]